MFCVYILSSKKRRYVYVGLSKNIVRRLKEHQGGQNKTTRPYKPFDLIHVEEFETRLDARGREKYLKSGAGKEWIKNNFEGGGTCLPAGRLVDALL